MFGKNRHERLRLEFEALLSAHCSQVGSNAKTHAEFHERIEKLFNWAVEYGERVRNLEAAENRGANKTASDDAEFDQIADLIANLSLRVSQLEESRKKAVKKKAPRRAR